MKISSILITVALLTSNALAQAVLYSAAPAPVVRVTPRPVVQTTAQPVVHYQAQPVAAHASPYRQVKEHGIYTEGTAFFGFGVSDAIKDLPELGELDIVGAEFTVGHRFNKFTAVNLRVSYGYGYGSISGYGAGVGSYALDMRQHTFALMPGVRQSFRLGLSPVEIFFGANAGLAVVGNYIDGSAHLQGQGWGYAEFDGVEAGFAYSVEVGVKYHYSQWGYVFAAYQFRGSTAAPDAEDRYDSRYYIETEEQMYHTIRLGAGMQF